MEQRATERPIIFFDGVCNLCNGVVQFIIRRDPKGRFLFASLQSPAGARLLQRIEQEKGYRPDSIVLLYKGTYYIKSNAVLKIGDMLKGGWQLMGAGYILPRFLRDLLYDAVARSRYRWFGKRNECMVATPDLKGRFIED